MAVSVGLLAVAVAATSGPDRLLFAQCLAVVAAEFTLAALIWYGGGWVLRAALRRRVPA
jgi:hypothetical protein